MITEATWRIPTSQSIFIFFLLEWLFSNKIQNKTSQENPHSNHGSFQQSLIYVIDTNLIKQQNHTEYASETMSKQIKNFYHEE